ncbi:SAP DNA-binding domain-containing protein [Tieghemostelium lacteum]|uniref:SAP DNA-binding domain-containing protein n=1 Tax=Tieghemostelium lacteum TaxID=361077 RepID=A0A151ZFL8_TIELA|nr:SAP DNA-binding domain-containing protein [Tieghemostelium lacteum]|eukprot:KYQ92771.1 SAP DNA-binding domain-containing protein [Tieghemostelium lacteum]
MSENSKKRSLSEIEDNSKVELEHKKKDDNEEEEEEDDDDDGDITNQRVKKKLHLQRKDCPYLDTVNRNLIDFDFEKVCSVSFNNHNVYMCLVCGKSFQGKSQDSYANLHCLQSNHHVFINLHNQKIYCLPDDYEVIDSSLDDIKYLLNPTYSKEQIQKLDENSKYSRALDGTQYLSGMVGLNVIKNNSYFNVCIQLLSKVPMLRNYFIDNTLSTKVQLSKSPLSQSLSELLRKVWNYRNFKSQVSPLEMMQVVQNISNRKFVIGENSDPLDLLQWLLNQCHQELGGTKDINSSIIYQTFAGEIQLTSKILLNKESNNNSKEQTLSEQQQKDSKKFKITKTKQPFLFLSLDLPPKPVFKDEKDKSILPQVSLFTLLEKYSGRENTMLNGDIKSYKILKLPEYLIFVIKRFSENNFHWQKEPTIVNFPLKNLDLSEYLNIEQKETYNLHSLIKHESNSLVRYEGEPDDSKYSIYINHKATDKWFEFQDLVVKKTMTQLINVSECYLLVYEKNKK